MASKKEWTVFLLARSTNGNDTKMLIYLLKEIEMIQFGPDVRIVFGVNFQKNNLQAILNHDQELVNDEESQDYTTMFFEFEWQNTDRNHLRPLHEDQHFDITNSQHIQNCFTEIIMQQYPADKFLLFTWDHGNGYEIFYDVHNPRSSLTIAGLNEAISNAFEKIDLLVMMNCFMQTIDTGYALRNSVNYLVAPQNLLLFDVYDYKRIFQVLAYSPCISAAELSSSVVKAVREKELCKTETVSVSALNLAKVEAIVYHLELLANRIEQRVRIDESSASDEYSILNNIKKWFFESYIVGSRIVDLYALINNLSKILNPREVEICNIIISEMDLLIIDSYSNLKIRSGSEFNRAYGISTKSPFTPSIGLLLQNFIEISKEVELTQHEEVSTEFSKSDWGKLIEKINRLYP